MKNHNPFRYFKTSPEIIRLAVMMYVRFPLSLRNVEDLLHERGIDICHETVRYWWNRFDLQFAHEICKNTISPHRFTRRTTCQKSGIHYHFNMNDNKNIEPIIDPLWVNARIVWSTCGTDLPESMTEGNAHYLTDLKVAAGTYRSAKEVTKADRARECTPEEVAGQCNALAQVLYQLDDAMFARLAGASLIPIPLIITETIANLHILESAFRNAKIPMLPRKKKQEDNNILVSVLADIYELHTKKGPSVYSDRTNNKRVGQFVNFVEAFNTQFMSGELSVLNARAIQLALAEKAKSIPRDRL